MMRCLSCKEVYETVDVGTCWECYEEASETEEELQREIEDLKAKLSFIHFYSLGDSSCRSLSLGFTVVVLASSEGSGPSVSISAHRVEAMLENEMVESQSGTIKISDASYDALRALVNFMYVAETCLYEQMACELLVLAEKYQVKHLKSYCEKFLTSKLNRDNFQSNTDVRRNQLDGNVRSCDTKGGVPARSKSTEKPL